MSIKNKSKEKKSEKCNSGWYSSHPRHMARRPAKRPAQKGWGDQGWVMLKSISSWFPVYMCATDRDTDWEHFKIFLHSFSLRKRKSDFSSHKMGFLGPWCQRPRLKELHPNALTCVCPGLQTPVCGPPSSRPGGSPKHGLLRIMWTNIVRPKNVSLKVVLYFCLFKMWTGCFIDASPLPKQRASRLWHSGFSAW